MKRVYCLYRVSTLAQTEKEDIPMQREACREFAKTKGWVIGEEFSERGISGFKVSSENREALQSLKRAAIQKQFDILLVFMFDRLGRRDDETPFVVEWFVKNGIEVWSVVEGEQRFEDHIDKLLNYIRYWQSSGESLKTSVRTKTRMEQLVKEGIFVGGTAPYGYCLYKLGRINKRGFEVHDILVEPKEAEVVREIFNLYCNDRMGTYRIAARLNQRGILTRRGAAWHYASILHILKNIVYTGVRKFNDTQSNHFPHLQIIDNETFSAAQKQMAANKVQQPQAFDSQYRTSSMFVDVLYCASCGKRMTVTRNQKTRQNKDGTQKIYDRLRYICINKHCNGQKTYSAKAVDELLLMTVIQFFSEHSIDGLKLHVGKQGEAKDKIISLEYALGEKRQTLHDLKGEVVEVIRGTSAFGSVLMAELIKNAEVEIAGLENEISNLHDLGRKQKTHIEKLKRLCGQLELFPALEIGAQKELIRHLVERVYIDIGYKYRIEWIFGGRTEG